MKTFTQSLVVEAALAGLFLAVAAAPLRADRHEHKAEGGEAPKTEKKAGKGHAKKAATVHCLGVNACTGTSACGVEGKHGCAGKNACKGQGWTALTKKACKKQKGTVQSAKKAESHTETAPAPAAK